MITSRTRFFVFSETFDFPLRIFDTVVIETGGKTKSYMSVDAYAIYTVLKTDDELEVHAKKLQEMGARNVLISMAGDGAMLISEDGQKFRIGVPKGKVRNSVGAGDSMVAGFIAGYHKYKSYEEALKMGTAAGSENLRASGFQIPLVVESR